MVVGWVVGGVDEEVLLSYILTLVAGVNLFLSNRSILFTITTVL